MPHLDAFPSHSLRTPVDKVSGRRGLIGAVFGSSTCQFMSKVSPMPRCSRQRISAPSQGRGSDVSDGLLLHKVPYYLCLGSNVARYISTILSACSTPVIIVSKFGPHLLSAVDVRMQSGPADQSSQVPLHGSRGQPADGERCQHPKVPPPLETSPVVPPTRDTGGGTRVVTGESIAESNGNLENLLATVGISRIGLFIVDSVTASSWACAGEFPLPPHATDKIRDTARLVQHLKTVLDPVVRAPNSPYAVLLLNGDLLLPSPRALVELFVPFFRLHHRTALALVLATTTTATTAINLSALHLHDLVHHLPATPPPALFEVRSNARLSGRPARCTTPPFERNWLTSLA
nr:hypothetical protein CFP56_71314 [Quercus suber]